MEEQEVYYAKRHHKRFILAIILFLLLIGSGIFWIMNKDKSSWSSIFAIVFTVLGVVFALFQWLLPGSPGKNTDENSSQKRRKSPEQLVFFKPESVEIEGVELEVSNKTGVLVVYTEESLRGQSLDLYWKSSFGGYFPDSSANVVRRSKNGETVFVAIFPCLPGDDYMVVDESNGRKSRVTVFAGRVAEVDWQS